MSLKDVEQMYALHSKFYDITRWLFVWNRNKAINKLELNEGNTVLVVGCGTGYGFDKILEQIGRNGKIIGIDYSKHMLGKARQKVQKNKWNNVELIQADAAYYKTKNVDAVLYSYSITMIPEWQKSLRNSYDALNKGGKLVIVDFGEIKTPLLKQLLNWNFRKHNVDNHLNLRKELVNYFDEVDVTQYCFGYNFILMAIK
ncbi:class I SAM-dependent methyltransferase [Candidatus Woesearchaeota archaeon]|nr:class I SAM-dependent methyltransferase [Candidatus Woesearchaeota archaeon]